MPIIKFLSWLILFGSSVLIIALHLQLWPLELLVSFTPLISYLLVGALAIVLGSVLISKKLLVNFKVVGILMLGLVLSLYSFSYSMNVQPLNSAQAKTGKSTIRFATFNKLYKNKDTDRLADYFKSQNIDVLALQEVNEGETIKIQNKLGFKYGYESSSTNTANRSRVSIVSRYPMEKVEGLKLSKGPVLVRAVVDTPNNGKVAFYSVHLPAPFSPDLYNDRKTDTPKLAEILNQEDLPAVVGGDFNTTVFSPSLKQFNQSTEEKFQTVSQDSWPACSWYGYGRMLCLRIDHVYIPRNAKLIKEKVAPDIGSDHRAILAEVIL